MFYTFTFKTLCAMWGWRRRRCSYCCPWGKSSLRIILRTKRWIIQLKLPPFDSIGRTLSLTFKFMFHPRLEWNHKCPFFYNSVAIICFIHKWNPIRKWAKLGSLCTQSNRVSLCKIWKKALGFQQVHLPCIPFHARW